MSYKLNSNSISANNIEVNGTETPSKLYMGETEVSKAYMGETEVTKAYMGETLVYEKSSSSGETWLLNESLGMNKLSKTNVSFKSNNENFVGIAYSTSSMGPQTLWYYKNDTEYVVACEYGTYSNEAYRTINFATPPTGNLLTWLQANGVKQ